MGSSGAVNCTRYALVMCHIFFLVVGIILLAVGLFVVAIPGTVHVIQITSGDMTQQQIMRLCYVTLGVGTAICFFALIGCIGTLNNSKCILILVGIVLIVVLIMEVVIGIFAILFQDEIHSEITDQMTATLSRYQGDNETDGISAGWRETQISFKCCGVNTAYGYQNHTNIVVLDASQSQPIYGSGWYRNHGSSMMKEWPESCCYRNSSGSYDLEACYNVTNLEDNKQLNKVGCQDEIYGFIQRHMILIAVLSFLLVFVQVGAMALSFKMYKYIVSNKVVAL